MVSLEGSTLALLQVEHKDGQSAFCRDFGILLPQRTGRRIAGIFEGRFVLKLLLFFQFKECRVRHIDFAAHLQKVRRVGQFVRDVFDGHDVLGHILAHNAVAAGRAAHELAHAVFKADRKTIDFRLDDILRLDASLAHAGVKLPQLVKRECVLQTLHLDGVRYLAEFAAGRAADMLCGRGRCDQLGVFSLDLL